jgi:parvulin-like peptidyl-prolyl isomerase
MKTFFTILAFVIFSNLYAQKSDEEVNDKLLHEAYVRMQWDIRASHILIKVDTNAPPADTLKVFNKILAIRDSIVKRGRDFRKMAIAYSDDFSARDQAAVGNRPFIKGNAGDLGYFTALDLVYPFETAAYNTKIGEVSMPFRTQFGYHLVYVTDRKPAMGKVQVAHILITIPANSTSADSAKYKTKINEIYDKIKGGTSFEDMAKQFSDDKASANKGGVIPWFGVNRMVPEFIVAISKLKKGDISAPIQTMYGWHIIKLIDRKEIAPFDSIKAELKVKIAKDSRSKLPKIILAESEKNKSEVVKATTLPLYPDLKTSDITFIDNNNNNRIDGNEKCFISFKITNNGKGAAKNVKAHILDKGFVTGLNLTKDTLIGTITSNSAVTIKIPINGTINLATSTAIIKVTFDEEMGFPPDPFELSIETKEFNKPEIKVVDYSFLTDNGNIKLGAPVQLKALIQNVGQGSAENIIVNFQYPSQNIFPTGESKFTIGSLEAGASKEIIFEFLPNKLYSEKTIPITIKVSEKYSKFGEDKQVAATLDAKSSGNTITITSTATDNNKVAIQIASLTSDVDISIPTNIVTKTNTYALIIGNEDYSSYQPNLSTEVNVDFAKNDATIFKEYCIKTLGIPEKQVILVTNATAAIMNQKLSQINLLAKNENGNAELIFYYSGHGLPDEQTKEPYLIPVDVSGSTVQSGVKLQTVYDKLTEYPTKKVTVFIDACFSGGARNQGLLAQRSIKIKPQSIMLKGNLVVFTSSSGDESSGAYKDKQHGYFTYFLLKKLQDTKGDVTFKDLNDYLKLNVNKESILNGKPQTPDILFSTDIKDAWGNWKMK